jgi:hypothetical protein
MMKKMGIQSLKLRMKLDETTGKCGDFIMWTSPAGFPTQRGIDTPLHLMPRGIYGPYGP